MSPSQTHPTLRLFRFKCSKRKHHCGEWGGLSPSKTHSKDTVCGFLHVHHICSKNPFTSGYQVSLPCLSSWVAPLPKFTTTYLPSFPIPWRTWNSKSLRSSLAVKWLEVDSLILLSLVCKMKTKLTLHCLGLKVRKWYTWNPIIKPRGLYKVP